MKHKIALVVLWISGSVAGALLIFIAYSLVMACIKDVAIRWTVGLCAEGLALMWAYSETYGRGRYRR